MSASNASSFSLKKKLLCLLVCFVLLISGHNVLCKRSSGNKSLLMWQCGVWCVGCVVCVCWGYVFYSPWLGLSLTELMPLNYELQKCFIVFSPHLGRVAGVGYSSSSYQLGSDNTSVGQMLVNLFLLRQALLKRTGVLWHTSECFVVLFCFSFFSSRRLKAFISNIYYRKWKAPTSGSQYTVGPLRAGPPLEFLNLTAVCTEP